MKVQSVHTIRGRGIVAVVPRGEAESFCLSVGAYVSSGERIWQVTGIDTARLRGDGVGIYLSGDVPPAVGDDLQVAGIAAILADS